MDREEILSTITGYCHIPTNVYVGRNYDNKNNKKIILLEERLLYGDEIEDHVIHQEQKITTIESKPWKEEEMDSLLVESEKILGEKRERYILEQIVKKEKQKGEKGKNNLKVQRIPNQDLEVGDFYYFYVHEDGGEKPPSILVKYVHDKDGGKLKDIIRGTGGFKIPPPKTIGLHVLPKYVYKKIS